MTVEKNKRLANSKSVAQKEFEANRLRELTINGIKLIHADRYNFTVEQNSNKGYFGTLKCAIKRFYKLLNGRLNIRFENFADEYSDVKPNMPCSLIDIRGIEKELLRGLENEEA